MGPLEEQTPHRPGAARASTRPRGATPEQDKALEEELLADPKEIAEHLMLIDLGRNDIGRISQVGTVELTDKMAIERYSHVMHIVSNVTGKLREGMSAMDVLRACHHEQYRSLLACGALSRRVWACARGGFSRRAGLVLCWQMHPRCFSEVGQSSTCTFHSALAAHSVSSVKSRCL